jgi:putative PEP-CTERM system histidine kinase
MFLYDVVLYGDALLFRRVSLILWGGRAIAAMMVTPLLAVAAARNRDWAIDIHVSRKVVFHTTTLVASGIFLLALALTGEIFRVVSPGWGTLTEVGLVIAGVVTVGVAITSTSARSYVQRILAENFFTHRYDYRREWLKSIEILSAISDQGSLQTRVIRAVAEIADSPAGLLWVRDLAGTAFQWAGSWNHPGIATHEPADSSFVALFRAGDWVIELDRADAGPSWLRDIKGAWLAVPLNHFGRMIGFIVLVRSRSPLEPNRETFDLLRIVARQAASHVVQQQYAQVLGQSEKMREYSNRFAFLVHDLKNIAGQLGMVDQNADLHKDDPEFQQDVLLTVRGALDRMNDLLASLRSRPQGAGAALAAPMELIAEQVTSISRRRGVDIGVDNDGRTARIAMDPGDFRAVIGHLCDNAIEASDGGVPIRIRHEPLRVVIDIVDKGFGMAPEFVRDKLFKPFGSTKHNGFGIGAYQARELLREAGGDLLVSSRRGLGTTMRVVVPCLAERAAAPPLLLA